MFTLPKLNYGLGSLEPVISREIMDLHYNKHHSTYVKKLNDALDGMQVEGRSIEDILKNIDELPQDIRLAVRNNGGGHFNHSLFWSMMTDSESEISDVAKEFFASKFGGLQEFKDKFTQEATGLFGSGWVWLLGDGTITTTANQDSPIMEGRDDIVLALDVWEHAYYLDYKNDRKQYVDSWWKVVNWGYVSSKLA